MRKFWPTDAKILANRREKWPTDAKNATFRVRSHFSQLDAKSATFRVSSQSQNRHENWYISELGGKTHEHTIAPHTDCSRPLRDPQHFEPYDFPNPGMRFGAFVDLFFSFVGTARQDAHRFQVRRRSCVLRVVHPVGECCIYVCRVDVRCTWVVCSALCGSVAVVQRSQC